MSNENSIHVCVYDFESYFYIFILLKLAQFDEPFKKQFQEQDRVANVKIIDYLNEIDSRFSNRMRKISTTSTSN